MIQAVLDTDVWLTGLGWQQAPSRRLVHAVLGGRVVPVSSPELLDEIDEVVRGPTLRRGFRDPGGLLGLIRSVSLVVEPNERVGLAVRPGARRLLEVARTAGADYVVTSEIELLRLGAFAGAKIVRPHPG